MTERLWHEREIPKGTPAEVVSAIQGSSLLIDRFGLWPTFEDSEVLALNFDRGNHWWVIKTGAWDRRIAPSLTATFYVFDPMHHWDSPDRKRPG
jgi:hypothetical protein